MAGLGALFPYQWRAYWRGLRSRSLWAGANATMVLVLAVLMLPGHIAGCLFAAARMRADGAGQGALLTEILLLGLFLGWFALPILTTGIETRGQTMAPIRLLQFPLTTPRLFLAGVTGTLVQPVYWVLLLASGLALLPLMSGPNPALGLAGGLLFIATAALVSWGSSLFGAAIFSSRRGREIALLMLTAFLISLFLVGRLDVETREGALYVTGLDRILLLASADGQSGLLARARGGLPSAWATRAALGSPAWLLPLSLGALGAFALSTWSLNFSLRHPPRAARGRGKRRALGALPGLPPALGAATRKEFNYLARTMDALLGIALGLGGAVYLFAASSPPVQVLLFGIPIILVSVSAMPMNIFGLDGRGVDRYRLLPLSGRDVILSKNLAYFLVSTLQLIPLFVAGTFRFGWAVGLAAPLFAASILLLFVLWGNTVSIRVPAPREFFNFDSKEQAGGFISQLYAAFIWGIPGLVAVFGYTFAPSLLHLGLAGVLTICIVFYRKSLAASGRLFEARAETMRDRLAT